ncbi:hypothetical protein B0H10DRAFT_2074586 [Mycena sp. CBHHK59/15]|nr:hypothetical protein B0H10DRAFT_2074586 [Mycena sp. CBHHK59/15]
MWKTFVQRISSAPVSLDFRFGSTPRLLAYLCVVQTFTGILKSGFKDPVYPCRHEPTFPTLAFIEFLKCTLSLLLLRPNIVTGVWRVLIPLRATSGDSARYADIPQEALPWSTEVADELPMEAVSGARGQRSRHWLTRKQCIGLIPLACLYLLRNRLLGSLHEYANQPTAETFDLLLIPSVGISMYLLGGISVPIRNWTSAFLQISAILLARLFTKVQGYNVATYALLVLVAFVSAAVLVVTSFVYRHLHEVSLHRLNLILFGTCLAGYAIVIAVIPPTRDRRTPPPPPDPRDLLVSGLLIVLRVAEDILSIAVLRQTSAFTYSALTLLSTALIPPLSFICFGTAIGFSAVQWIASVLAVYAAASHCLNGPIEHTQPQKIPRWPHPRSLAIYGLSFLPLFALLSIYPLSPIPRNSTHVWPGSHLGTLPPMPHKLLPTINSTKCQRNPLPPSSAYPGPGPRPDDFHAFDDILLVVFFSHARYNINLDGYREVYSRYFPNILFIGPASREDRGFLRSYDVVVDSYMSGEDFGSGWYKMAGRMAHHMFYTAVKDNPCYAGYLWAPFDALLNVPRLAQFPQDRIWYHSPFSDHYVPNPALRSAFAKHAPPAMVSEKSPAEYTAEVAAWGAGWHGWWGELHVGLKICVPAYRLLPLQMRRRLESLIGAPERFVGGSADTMYIPGHLRNDFLDVVGTFLLTNCFLEIVLPTTLHLILPAEEDIVFLDHWWIHKPPYNTSFVRQKWEEGFEVDSLHTFHWGDTHEDGFFRANENSVEDIRSLLEDSFERQQLPGGHKVS